MAVPQPVFTPQLGLGWKRPGPPIISAHDLQRVITVRAIRVVAVLALTGAMSTAQAQEGKFIVGPRDFSCGMWTNTPKNTAQHDVLESWVLGYLSGINAESAGGDFLRGREPGGLVAWIDDYCRRNPLHIITQSTNELIKELRSGR